MQMNSSIANQIVKRTKNIIDHSINVMNEYGIIIASNDPNRINQQHDGAILALTHSKVIEIDDAMAKTLNGVKLGINLPILYQNKPIGVIGISGDPDKVRSYGQLVKMAAELIIEQSITLSQFEWTQRHKEELALQLINKDQLEADQLQSIAQNFKLDINLPRVALVVRINHNKNSSNLEHLRQLLPFFEQIYPHSITAITSVQNSELVVLKPIHSISSTYNYDSELDQIKKLINRIKSTFKLSVRIALGEYFPHVKGIPLSYTTAKATLDISLPSQMYPSYRDNTLPVLLHGLQHEQWRQKLLQEPLLKLQSVDANGILVKTLKAYFAQNCDLTQTCEALHIHRNTLRYRLDKIETISSLSFNKISDKTQLYLALLF